jgi:hypothetical protein
MELTLIGGFVKYITRSQPNALATILEQFNEQWNGRTNCLKKFVYASGLAMQR